MTAGRKEELLDQIYRCFKFSNLYFVKFFFISVLCVLCSPVHNAVEEKPHGLYKSSDPIIRLTNDTLMEQLTGNGKVWIVEFYSTWCGHCQAFAPKWVSLGVQLKNWDKYVNIGATDCAAERNNKICRTFHIDMYPTIKLFDVNWQNNTEGTDEEGNLKYGITFEGSKKIADLRNHLIDRIEKQDSPDYDKSSIPFGYIGMERIFEHRNNMQYKYLALIFEEEVSYIGKNIILDTSKSKHLIARRASDKDKPMLKKYNVIEFPSLVLLKLDNGEFEHLSRENRTYLGFIYSLQKVLDFIAKPSKPTTEEDIKTVVPPIVGNKVSSEIFMQDLISAVSFSLWREIPKKPIIKAEALDALKDWVNLLVQCFPAETYMLSFLMKLDKWLQNNSKDKKIHSADYLKYLEVYQKSNSYLPQKIEWRGCQGSHPKYRGFPCGLWTLFHTMTVDCGSKYSKTSLSGLQILTRIRSFIDFFFGCRYCRDHFVSMAKNVANEVSSHDDAIMWLWKGHNKANARIKDDASADPFFPKVQFPPEVMCPECHKPTLKDNTLVIDTGYDVPVINWNKVVVLDFLKQHYGSDNIRVKDNIMIKDTNGEADSIRLDNKFYPKSKKKDTLSFIGLTNIDMSLCVVLYIAVIGTLIALYLYFIKRRKKKEWKNII